jgi:HD-GYP domain-containing protein (c-di-GMP phosphodiesterase class II)
LRHRQRWSAVNAPSTPRKRPAVARAYVAGVIVLAAVALSLWIILIGLSLVYTTLLLGLALGAMSAGARFLPVGFGVGRASFDTGGVPIFAALILGGPACALLAAVPSAVHRDPSRTAFMGAIHIVQVLAGAFIFAQFCPEPLLVESQFSATFVLGTITAGLAFFGLDALIGPTLMRLKYGLLVREVVEEIVVPALPSDALAIAATLATALAVATFGPSSAIALLAGAALSLAAVNVVRDHRKKVIRLASENEALKEALRDSNLEIASRLVGRLGQRDGYAAAHAAASAVYAADIARECGLDEGRCREVRMAALLMDVGLLWVPDDVLLVPEERLNSLGRMHLEEHPIAGEGVLSGLPGLEEAARWVRWHHERPDGTGYPDRLKEAWTPQEAKILAVASLYASLVLDGPSALALTPAEARQVLVAEIGKAADEGVTRILLRLLAGQDESYASASDERFVFDGITSVEGRGSVVTKDPLSRGQIAPS